MEIEISVSPVKISLEEAKRTFHLLNYYSNKHKELEFFYAASEQLLGDVVKAFQMQQNMDHETALGVTIKALRV